MNIFDATRRTTALHRLRRPYGPKTKTTLDLASQRAENGIPQYGFHI
jgi:hypothetical protein